MSQSSRSAIVTLAMGQATERLDHTFLSFAEKNPGIPLHAFILGDVLPQRRFAQIQYHLLKSILDFSDPHREVYFRRLEILDELDVDYALTVDCFDVLCLQPLPPFEQLLAGAHVAAAVERFGCCYILGQGYTSNFLNGGVFLWNVPRSRDIRSEVLQRGRAHLRNIQDDQLCLNEVINTKYFDRLRILPTQYNFRAFLNKRYRGWPTVTHLDGVVLYHNVACIAEAKKLQNPKPRAELPPLPLDGRPLTPSEIFWRRLRNKFRPWIVK
jgi:hypothetical protein